MAIAVALGAMGAHGLKSVLDTEALKSFETGVRYQVYHSLALLVLSGISLDLKRKLLIFRIMGIGVLLFSGSIYFLSLRSVLPFGESLIILGPVTPLGGIMLIASWILLGLGLKNKAKDQA